MPPCLAQTGSEVEWRRDKDLGTLLLLPFCSCLLLWWEHSYDKHLCPALVSGYLTIGGCWSYIPDFSSTSWQSLEMAAFYLPYNYEWIQARTTCAWTAAMSSVQGESNVVVGVTKWGVSPVSGRFPVKHPRMGSGNMVFRDSGFCFNLLTHGFTFHGNSI